MSLQNNEFKFQNRDVAIPFALIIFIWFIYWVEIKFNLNFNRLGVYPRTFSGLKGILFSPFIHSDVKHLFNNSVPLLLFSIGVFYFYKEVALKVFVLGGLFTGFFTWIIAREAYHIGASGIVYLLFSFIFFSGLLKKHYRLVAMSLTTILSYGSMVWYVFPIEKLMSWEGHLSGMLIGLILAILYRKQGVVLQKYEFVKTDFDDMFDDQGNYVPPVLAEEEIDESNNVDSEADFHEIDKEEKKDDDKKVIIINYKYVYKSKTDK